IRGDSPGDIPHFLHTTREAAIWQAFLAQVATLHDRQIRRLRALEDATGVDPNLTKPTDNVRSVAHQPTDFPVIAHRVDRREPVECCQLGQLDPSTVQERGDPDEEGIGALATDSFEGGIDLRTAV